MNRKLYALTDDTRDRLENYARVYATTAANCAADELVPMDLDAGVERMAIQMCATGRNESIWADFSETERDDFRKDARAALTAAMGGGDDE